MARSRRASVTVVVLAVAKVVVSLHGQQPPVTPRVGPGKEDLGFRFRSGVELINVTATVSDASGRFVSGLTQEDFTVYEDDERQAVTHFSADRVPVSLGIALDTSQSMAGEKIQSARRAIDQLLADLSDPQDEFFLYRFSDDPVLLQDWTGDRKGIGLALMRATPSGRTALYDTIVRAVPRAQTGQNRRKALVVISDGNDTTSRTSMLDVRRVIRDSETLVYAVGIDCGSEPLHHGGISQQRRGPPMPFPMPFPVPPRGRGRFPQPPLPQRQPPSDRGWLRGCQDPVDAVVLRDMTEVSGGRTEIIRDPRDLNPSTASIADELSKQYDLGYPSAGKKDGLWHAIRVEVRNRNYRVRARRGYIAS